MEVTLAAETRTGTGKGVARKLRAQGKVPGTLYGIGGDPQTLTVEARALAAALHTEAGRNVLIDLQVGGETHLAMTREIQKDPIRGSFIHVDFLRIDRTKTIQVDVPVHIEGDAPGIREGGVIEHHLWSIKVECLPGNVPESLIADLSAVQLGESVHVSDLKAPDGVTILTTPEETVLSVVVPQVLKVEEEVPVEEAVAAEGEAAAAPAAEGAAPPAES